MFLKKHKEVISCERVHFWKDKLSGAAEKCEISSISAGCYYGSVYVFWDRRFSFLLLGDTEALRPEDLEERFSAVDGCAHFHIGGYYDMKGCKLEGSEALLRNETFSSKQVC